MRGATPDDAEALAEIVVDSTVTTFRGLVPDRCLNALTKEESANNWRRWFRNDDETTFLLVAQSASGRVVGCALA